MADRYGSGRRRGHAIARSAAAHPCSPVRRERSEDQARPQGMKRAFAALTCLAFVASACAPAATPSASTSPSPSPIAGIELAAVQVPRTAGTADDAAAAGAAIDAFGLDLYRLVAADGGNVVVSPASIAIAVIDGPGRCPRRDRGPDRRGVPLARLRRARRLDQRPRPGAGEPDRDLPGRDGRDAGRHAADRQRAVRPARHDARAGRTSRRSGARFGAGLRLVDYKTDPEAVRAPSTTGWTSRPSSASRSCSPRAPSTTLTRLVLVNAIYLKAAWQTPFGESATAAGALHPPRRHDRRRADDDDRDQFEYAAGDGWQAVELPYVGGQLAMTIVVPDDLAAFVDDLDADALRGRSSMRLSLDPGRPVDAEVRHRDEDRSSRRSAGRPRHAARLRPTPRTSPASPRRSSSTSRR